MIEFNCPRCGNHIKVSEKAAGKSGTCNKCNDKISVPEAIIEAASIPDELSADSYPIYLKWVKISSIALGLILSFSFVLWTIISSINANDKLPLTELDAAKESTARNFTEYVLPDDYETFDKADAVPQTEDFNETTWHYVGRARGVRGRLQMIPIMYTTGERDRRLVIEYASIDEQVYEKMIYEQSRIGGRWLGHGLRENILFDGSRDKYSKVAGEYQGISRKWYPNGQLRKEENYSNGKLQGRSRGWWENGNLQYESIYHQDKEVEGKGFNEDGTER